MQLVMRCDDFGYTNVFNMGLKKVLEEGIVSHVELMPDTPGAIDAMETMRRYPWVSVGWHKHFRGKPVLPPEQVPTLVDGQGRFRFREVWSPDMGNPTVFEGVDERELTAELTAEVDLFLRHMGRVPDCSGTGRPGTVMEAASRTVCERFGIPYDCSGRIGPDGTLHGPSEKWKLVKLVMVNQPSHPVYLCRTAEDSTIRNCTYDPLGYMLRDEQHILDLECGMMAWHPGYLDDYMYEDATYFYEGNRRFFEGSMLRDVTALCSPELRRWIRENRVELISVRDALYGTHEYQNHLRAIGSDLYMDG